MAEINQTLTQLKLEPANNKNLRSFVGELNGNLKTQGSNENEFFDWDLFIQSELITY